jgi:transcriptional regulator with XRE-family HTH domain
VLAFPAVSTKLAAYLKRNHLSHRAFAARVGLPHLHPMVGLWAKGSRSPGLETAFAIEKGTAGEIPASYWAALRSRKKSGKRVVRESSAPHLQQRST